MNVRTCSIIAGVLGVLGVFSSTASAHQDCLSSAANAGQVAADSFCRKLHLAVANGQNPFPPGLKLNVCNGNPAEKYDGDDVENCKSAFELFVENDSTCYDDLASEEQNPSISYSGGADKLYEDHQNQCNSN